MENRCCACYSAGWPRTHSLACDVRSKCRQDVSHHTSASSIYKLCSQHETSCVFAGSCTVSHGARLAVAMASTRTHRILLYVPTPLYGFCSFDLSSDAPEPHQDWAQLCLYDSPCSEAIAFYAQTATIRKIVTAGIQTPIRGFGTRIDRVSRRGQVSRGQLRDCQDERADPFWLSHVAASSSSKGGHTCICRDQDC